MDKSLVILIDFLAEISRIAFQLDRLDVRTATSVQTFGFSTLYTLIPHDLLKSRISNLVHNVFFFYLENFFIKNM